MIVGRLAWMLVVFICFVIAIRWAYVQLQPALPWMVAGVVVVVVLRLIFIRRRREW